MRDQSAPEFSTSASYPPVVDWNWSEEQQRHDREPSTRSLLNMLEFAKRIESSAGTSTAWGRLGGNHLSKVRSRFAALLMDVLEGLEFDIKGLHHLYEAQPSSRENQDIVVAFCFVSLLASAACGSGAHPVARAEVSCTGKGLEYSCFLTGRSAGVTVRNNDNLFSLCTSALWRLDFAGKSAQITTLRREIERHGGLLRTDAMDSTTIYVVFPGVV